MSACATRSRRVARTAFGSALVVATALGVAAEAPSAPQLTLAELMNHVLDPATDVVWGAAGTVSTLEGERSLAPTTDEGWAAVANAGAVIVEASTALQHASRLPAAATDRALWLGHTARLGALGRQVMQAAQARDDAAIFDVGGQLYETCTACHERFDSDIAARQRTATDGTTTSPSGS